LSEARNLLRGGIKLTNRNLRRVTGLNYDQSIKFFARAVEAGVLERNGQASSTHYRLPLAAGKEP